MHHRRLVSLAHTAASAVWETRMKIKIVKKATNMKPSAYCGLWMDDPPMNKK
jgi:hypothetical protein